MNYLESLFIDADLSGRLVNLGFEKSKCLAGLNNLGNIIMKTDLSKNGHDINWDKQYCGIKLLVGLTKNIIFIYK